MTNIALKNMPKKILIFTLLILVFANNSFATDPCRSPTKEWFATNVIKKSDLVVYGVINDYSSQTDSESGWTKIGVLDVLKGNYSDKELTITGWQAVSEPRYFNQKGSYAVLWIKTQDSKYFVTDLNWGFCVPSVWDATNTRTASSKMDYSTMSLDEIKKMITESSAK